MRKSLFICIALLLFSASAYAQTANEILARVASVYAGCRTYSDEGSTVTEMSGQSMPSTRHWHFRTAFVRPAGFRFELWFNSDKRGDPWIVWKSGDVIKSRGTASAGDVNLPFDTALLRLAMPSSGSSLTIPQLLMPGAFRIIDLFSLIVDAKVAGEDKIDGHHCFRIEGTFAGLPVMLWIDRTQYLVLKSYRRVRNGGREEESTVQYTPRLNADIPPENLALPPSPNRTIPSTSTSKPVVSASVSPPVLAPNLRGFGSSLSRGPDEKKDPSAERMTKDEDVVRIETDLVVCPVLVVDPQGKIISGLKKEDFIVKEDNQPQEVASLSLGDNKDVPRSIVLIIDYSGSQLPYIKTSIEAAKMLVDKLNPKDRMAVVTDDVKMLVDFTSDKQLLKTQLESLKTNALAGTIGASEQYDALMATLNELFNNEDARPIIIFQTDGDQLDSLKGNIPLNAYSLPRKYSLEDLLTATEKTRATLYSVISGVKFANAPEDELAKRAKLDWENRRNANLDLMQARNLPLPKSNPTLPPDEFFVNYGHQWQRRQMSLVGVANFTGTLPEFLEDPSQADEIYTRVLTDIDRRYVIGYYPTNRSRDGHRRSVSIQVRDHPEYVVWGQKTYFAKQEK
jgi:VWFA-related protein